MDIDQIISSLSKKRPVFYSEADFQHALAWEFHSSDPLIEVRLEIPDAWRDKNASIDMRIRAQEKYFFFELKYKTVRTQVSHESEKFALKNHSAKPQGVYDFIKDIQRLESFVESTPGAEGYAIILSNDRTYWNGSRKDASIDKDFLLVEGRELSGTLGWSSNAGIGSIKGREKPISLSGKYKVNWKSFSDLSAHGGKPFKYLCLHIR